MSNKIKAMIMLDNENTDHNLFPIDAFPQLFKELTLELDKSLNYPIDYTASAILVATSAVMGTSVKVNVRPLWSEFASLYCCIVGKAGANKSHPISTIFDPLRRIDSINHKVFETQRKKFNEYESLTKTEKKNVPKVEEPMLKKLILTNCTPEALFKRLNENPRGCTIISDELPTFLDGINNYSKSDQQSNFLTTWSNKPTTIDRISQPIPLFIETPFLSIIGGVQPRMLGRLFTSQKLDNGFYQRFLFAYPDNVHKQPINDNEMDENLFNDYTQFITDYIDNSNIIENKGILNTKILEWSDEAKDFWLGWNKNNCDLVNEHHDSIKGEILSKYDNHFIRLALILQIMENPKSNSIGLKAVEGAKKLCNYYINCSFKVLQIIQNPTTYLKSLTENKRNFYEALNNKFATADATKLCMSYNIGVRQTKEFLKDEILFKRLQHGFYEKKIVKTT